MILQLLYLYLPAYIANMTPFLARRIFPKWNTPIDLNMKINRKRILGKNKTIRGLLCGTIAAIITTGIQKTIEPTNLQIISYENWMIIGFLLGFGALTGDAIKSFFKRQLEIKPGQPLYIIDQIDYILGATLFISPYFFIGWTALTYLLSTTLILTIIVNHLSYFTGIRKEQW